VDSVEKYGPLVGRILLALIFFLSGLNKIFAWDFNTGYMAAKGMPMVAIFLVAAIVIEIGGSLSVILGYKARWGAVALIVFTIPASVIFHNFWALKGMDQVLNMAMFMKNFSIIGGLLLVVAFGAGQLSMDNRKSAGERQT